MLRIKELRKRAGLNQVELAKLCNISQGTLSAYETGRTDPDLAILKRLADFFGVSIDYLLGGSKARAQDEPPAVAVKNDRAVRIPVLGTIPAGIPLEAIEDIVDYEEIPGDWIHGNREYFGLRVKGVSMYPEYKDGDVVILRKQCTAESGQDVAVFVGDDNATFKRFRRSETGILLQALNPACESYMYTLKQAAELPIKIIGVVVELRRKIK